MNAVLAIIAGGGRAIAVIERDAVEINNFLLLFIDSAKTLRLWPCPTPSAEAPGGGVCWANRTMPLEGEMAPSWRGCLCACV